MGCYGSESEAAEAASRLGEGYAARSSSTGVLVTVTRTANVLFEFDSGGVFDLAVQPEEKEGETSTWFKGYKYSGAFEYPRVTGGSPAARPISRCAMENRVRESIINSTSFP